MFPFGGNPFDIEVEKATNEKNTSEDWGLILDICDKVSQSSANAKLCVKSIIKRLNHADPHVVLKAITLLDACVNNCGKTIHLEIASREFESEYKKLITKSHPIVQQKLKELLKIWAEGEFKSDQQLNLIPSLFAKLKIEGIDFNPPPDMVAKKSPQLSKDPNVAANQQEVDDIAKAIELSLKEKSGSPRTSSNNTSSSGAGAGAGSSVASSSLYPSTNIGTTSANPVSAPSEARKVRALYDFEAAEDNELTFLAGEIIHVIDDSDQNWWKGGNQRGEGLFPANFVTADLSVEPEHLKIDQKKVQFQENEVEKTVETEPEDVEINEEKIDRLLHLLHEADPSDAQHDTQEMIHLEEQVNNMGPLIDAELERVDRKHAQLTQLSSDLVEGLNLYHTLMREPDYAMLPKHMMDRYRPTNQSHMPPNHMYNGALPPHPAGMPPYAYPVMPLPQGAPGPVANHDIRPPFMALPPGAPPMSLPPRHFQMPPGMNAMPSPHHQHQHQHQQPMGGMPPPGMNMPPQQKIEDRGPASIPPQYTPAPGNIPNYGPPGMMQQPGAPFVSPHIVTSQTMLGVAGVPPPQSYVPAPTASSHHLM